MGNSTYIVEAIIGALRQFISRAVGSEEAKGMLRGGEAVGLRVAITTHLLGVPAVNYRCPPAVVGQ